MIFSIQAYANNQDVRGLKWRWRAGQMGQLRGRTAYSAPTPLGNSSYTQPATAAPPDMQAPRHQEPRQPPT